MRIALRCGHVAILTCAITLGACVVSIDPIVEETGATFDERLLGAWDEVSGSDRACVSRASVSTYAIEYRSDGEVFSLEGRLGELGGRSVLDIWPTPHDGELPDIYAELMVAGHLLVVVEIEPDEIQMAPLEPDLLLEGLRTEQPRLAYGQSEDQLVLYGTTEELRAALGPYLTLPGALDESSIWRRSRTVQPTDPVSVPCFEAPSSRASDHHWVGGEGRTSEYFVIRVVDDQSGRGVPLVALKLENEVEYWTDSAGVAAFDEPALRGLEVLLAVRSDGYEYQDEMLFVGRGAKVKVEPGRIRELRIRRTMIAERLYRLTGEGIYRDSLMAGLPVPMDKPLLNAQVLGQDTVSAAIYQGRIFWIWGDTTGPAYRNFSVSAATSDLQDNPAVAINYDYFTDSEGRTKEMLPLSGEGLVWIEGLIPMADPEGEERLIATYTRNDGLEFPDECGLALFDDTEQVFQRWVQVPCRKGHYSSHPFLHDGYWYLYPWLRVANDWDAIQDSSRWEERDVLLAPGAKRPSCVVWNEHRQRWILLMEDFGDVYYAEAMQPEGPYGSAVRIVHHDQYNFYNVVTHPFFNQEGGRIIYLEGTYTDSFTSAPTKTPRYNYNQVMFRLELNDSRLRLAQE